MKATLALSLAAAGSDAKVKNSQTDRYGNGGQSLFPDHLSLSLWWERAPAVGRQSA
jgi:hypothetical protein